MSTSNKTVLEKQIAKQAAKLAKNEAIKNNRLAEYEAEVEKAKSEIKQALEASKKAIKLANRAESAANFAFEASKTSNSWTAQKKNENRKLDRTLERLEANPTEFATSNKSIPKQHVADEAMDSLEDKMNYINIDARNYEVCSFSPSFKKKYVWVITYCYLF
jgi:DNA repair exonuclease SbcCD ATPase subunit